MLLLGEAIAQVMPDLRAQAESLMTDRCVIDRLTGSHYDPATRTQVDDWQQVYAGQCRIRPVAGAPAAGLTELAGQEINSQAHLGTLPITVTGVQAGDRVTVTDSDDQGQIGHQYPILAVSGGSHGVARRFVATENQG